MKHFVVNRQALSPPVSLSEAQRFFGPMEAEEAIVFTPAQDMESLAVLAGLFSSKGQARRNGFRGPVPHGLGWYGFRKPHRRFWVWNPAPTEGADISAFDHTEKWFLATGGAS